MKKFKLTFGLIAAMLLGFTSASAQVTLSGGADIVSSYVWRGAYTSAASFQPGVELAAGNFAVGAWGSTPFDTTCSLSEVDYYVSYSLGNLGVTVTDYWWDGAAMPYFDGGHYYEAALSYSFGESFPLSLSVSTMFAGADTDVNGDQLYSTYVEVGYPFEVGDVALDVAVGLTPQAGMYADDFGVCNVSATASKAVAITDSFELPMFVSAIVNPAGDRAYLLFGTSLSF
ncbi:MAG: hypothetical protein R3Y08_04080 [Rikenellaceae bacterium]